MKNPTVVFTKPMEAVIEECEIPCLGENELLVKTRVSLISTGTELTMYCGEEYTSDSLWAELTKYPIYPGYCNIGEVVEIGKGSEKEWVGKKIAISGHHSVYNICNIQDANIIHQDIPDEEAAFFTLALITMNSVRRANVRWGESVVIYGMGLIGQLTARFCRICGARPVVGVDISDFRLGKLPKDNAIIAVNSRSKDISEIVEKATRGRMADVVFEATGAASLIPQEFKVLRKHGRFVVQSSPRGKTLFDFHDLCNFPSHTIIGTHICSYPSQETLDNPWTKKRDCELFFDLVADSEIDVRNLISHKADYSKAPELYRMLAEDRSNAMGVILDWSK